LHGTYGEDAGTVSSCPRHTDHPARRKASSTPSTKIRIQMLFHAAGIPTPPWAISIRQTIENYDYYDDNRKKWEMRL
jgi:hypothetical protein